MKKFRMMVTWDFDVMIEAENEDRAGAKFQDMTWDEVFAAARKAGILETVETLSESEEE